MVYLPTFGQSLYGNLPILSQAVLPLENIPIRHVGKYTLRSGVFFSAPALSQAPIAEVLRSCR